MKSKFLSLLSLFIAGNFVLMPVAFAQVDPICSHPSISGLPDAQKPSSCRDPGPQTAGDNKIINTISNISKAIGFFVGIFAIVYMILGGMRLQLSNGNPEQVKSARSSIFNSIIGLVIAFSAEAIAFFVLDRL